MNYQFISKKTKILILLLLLHCCIETSSQQLSCVLPDGRSSICTRFQYCENFALILRSYNGKPPDEVRQKILSHQCQNGNNVFCCPDNATTSSVPPPTQPPTAAPTLTLAPPGEIVDYNGVKNHKNFKLVNDESCGKSTADRIVGGENARLLEIPWQALLGYQLLDSFQYNCGGTLITKRYVLTAAHCITRKLVNVRLGEYDKSKSQDCDDFNTCADPVQEIMIEKIIRHPGFETNKKPARNDIALLRLATAADTSKNNVKTVCLPVIPESDLSRASATKIPFTISGWGQIGEGTQTADILQRAYVPLVPNDECSRKFGPGVPIHSTYICAGGHNKTDACKGDSGGGITSLGTLQGTRQRVMLFGVVAGGVSCDEKSMIFPGIYTNIKFYLKWILDNLSE